MQPSAGKGSILPIGFYGVAQSICAVLLATVNAVSPAYACGFDLTKPERSLIDWIVEADELAIARPQKDNPFKYEIEEVLVGAPANVNLPNLVSSVLRRKLSANPNDGMLFARVSSVVDGSLRSSWKQVSYVDGDTRSLIASAIEHRRTWSDGYHETRRTFVESLQGNDHPAIKVLVINEFDKMPYEMLREADIRLSSSELVEDLWTLEGYPFQTTRVLMLGLTGDQRARDEVHAFFDRREDWHRAINLAAFSAALIELDGTEGIKMLSDRVLSKPNLNPEALEQVILAFAAINRLVEPEVHQAIGQAITDLVAERPNAGVIVARQFSAVSDWSQLETLKPLVRERKFKNLNELLVASVYLAKAKEARDQKQKELPF